ncbi:hypothetical protein ABS71_09645 [bacterium SCN 62-11]|nr:MAG: hypothetical protein ABS71_09645 [bacterium SCN 62-11]
MKLDTVKDHECDGHFVGADGKCYHPDTYWRDVPPVLPNNGKPAYRSVVMVNGIMTDVALQASDMQRMANTGCKVVGVHNATKGMMRDLAQCVGDKLNLRMANNGATSTVAKVVRDILNEVEPPLLVGHSQGALVLSNALGSVDASLKNLDVMTLGGASWSFPSGPKYKHFVNVFDGVPMGAGVGALSCFSSGTVSRFSEVKKPTNLPSLEEDVSNYLARVVDRSVHGPQDIYIPELEKKQGT